MKVGVLGAGSWGTALAQVLADNDQETLIWGIDEGVCQDINENHRNSRYLSDAELNPKIQATSDLKSVVKGSQIIVYVLPTAAIREVSKDLNVVLNELGECPIIVHATKGLERGTNLRVSQIIKEELDPKNYQDIVVLSGPSHAEEVARRYMTTLTAACSSLEVAELVQQTFMNKYMRIYTNKDVIGVELGGALKNIYAVMAGIVDELKLGDNAKAAMMTRGLAEMTRLGVKLGADPLTFSGLSGVGDLIVTCTSEHSRNFQAGRLIAKGYRVDDLAGEIDMVVEGVSTVVAAVEKAKEVGVDLPLAEGLYQLLYHSIDLKSGLEGLMTRAGKQEASLEGHMEIK